MRILHLIPQLSGGGAERQLSYLAPELARRGNEVHIAYTRDGPLKPALENVKLHRLKSRSSYDPWLLWQFIRLVRKMKPDVINTWIIQSDVMCAITAKITGTPWCLREPGSAMAHPPSLKNSLRVRAASTANAIISNSRGGDKYWAEQLPSSRRFIVRNGLPIHKIMSIAARLPFESPRSSIPMILYAGRLASDGSATKNLVPLLHALAMVAQRREIFAVICGDGPQVAELRVLSSALRLDDAVFFTGYLSASEVWALMKKAAVFVSLSAHEGAPNTVMEAMTCGCPLILSDIPAHREVAEDAVVSFVDPSDINQTADEIDRAIVESDAARCQAERLQYKTLEWSIEKMSGQFELIYKSIV